MGSTEMYRCCCRFRLARHNTDLHSLAMQEEDFLRQAAIPASSQSPLERVFDVATQVVGHGNGV